jgi:SAM-dependent methyltransferase
VTSTREPGFWQAIYAAKPRPEWDMNGPTPLIPEILGHARDLEAGAAVVVPGCGFGHDAAELGRRGFQVTGLDFAEPAIQGARSRYPDAILWRQEDWFDSEARFDAIFDHTCFVAMDPVLRPRYVQACVRHLRPGGLWLGAFFHTVAVPGGPPFAVDMEELRGLVQGSFEILHLDHATCSHPRRAGREFILVARRKDPAGSEL